MPALLLVSLVQDQRERHTQAVVMRWAFLVPLAGLKVERVINEPTAAAIAYGLDKK